MTVANPIYDIVFKFLMEDSRVARTILSALLKKEVADVKVRPHEYSKSAHNSLSIFRIDFGATIRDEDGSESLILIEVQKTWLETETLRFRQYLGVQYSSKENINESGNALPMVAVYLLGHRVGDIEEPVLYVKHHPVNYDGQPVTKGLPDPFVNSLNHESIIVQIPLLHGQINNRLDKVLSIFDQSNRDKDDSHRIYIDESKFQGDEEMDQILRRLTMAAADKKVRRDMEIEDEILSLVEKRESELLLARHALKETEAELDRQRTKLNETESELDRHRTKLNETESELDRHRTKLNEKDAQLSATIKMLLDLGKSPEEIATTLGMDINSVITFSHN